MRLPAAITAMHLPMRRRYAVSSYSCATALLQNIRSLIRRKTVTLRSAGQANMQRSSASTARRSGSGGDSAGGTLTVTTCMMARDRACAVRPRFQLLIYPWLDDRNTSASYLKYTDTPMWNSTLSKRVGPLTNPDPSLTPLAYRSPVEADSFEALPPAYIEVAEFDPLHDDGICYAGLLTKAGIPVELHEPERTMHGFDSKVSAPTTQAMLQKRVEYMRRMFAGRQQC